MNPIGGFYELLLPQKPFSYHDEALALSNGRACIRMMIRQLNIKKCYLPNYTCDAVYHPFDAEGVPYELYSIDSNLEPTQLPALADGEYFYYINYYGIKSGAVGELHSLYGNNLLIDNTHDFFKRRQYDCASFTSARKYFGVPDGAFLYTPLPIDITDLPRFNKYSVTHAVERLKGNQERAFEEFQEYEQSLDSELCRISLLSERMLSLVDIDRVKHKRRDNFRTLHRTLGMKNDLTGVSIDNDDVPFAYPFLPQGGFDKTSLYPLGIFIPSLWKDPLSRENSNEFETRLANSLLALPIDERYDENDMLFMAEQILARIGDV